MSTAVLPCICTADSLGNAQSAKWQDQIHGHGRRLHNPCKPKVVGPWFRCTICGSEQTRAVARAKGKASQ